MDIQGIGSAPSYGVYQGGVPPPMVPSPDDYHGAMDSALGIIAGVLGGPADPQSLYERLQSLEQSDPNQAAQALTTIAGGLRAQGEQVGGPQADLLNQMANIAEQIAKTGDLSILRPPEGMELDSNISSGIAEGAVATSALSQPDQAVSDPQRAAQVSGGGAEIVTVSKAAQLASDLHELVQTDPATVEQMLSAVSENLRSRASQVGGPDAEMLSKLSEQFAVAAQTGDISVLMPKDVESGPNYKALMAYARANGQAEAISDALDWHADTPEVSTWELA